MIGRSLSHYRVGEELSRGGMGVVYRALDVKLEREVALKVLPPELVRDEERKHRFLQEAKAAASLKHPNIAVIHEVDEVDGVTFLVMELIEGEKLSDRLARERLPFSHALTLAVEITDGLSRAHERGIVHRDLKPANIMVTEDGHPKIIDFGLAKLMEPLHEVTSQLDTAAKVETQVRSGDGNSGLHVARTGPGAKGRSPERPLQPGHRPLRDAHRKGALHRGERFGAAARHHP